MHYTEIYIWKYKICHVCWQIIVLLGPNLKANTSTKLVNCKFRPYLLNVNVAL
jgi:hypothetical protein